MIDWLTSRSYRFPALLIGYFFVHVIIRSTVSGSLSFDESEQAFLSQWIEIGYNSQPPLYTWVQAAAFGAFGHSVVAMAIVKNVLLLGTYLLVYWLVYRGTGNRVAAIVSTLGILTIPQVAWESHRDLSHTVAVTFATALLLYSIVRLERAASHASDGRLRWYIAIGIAAGIGMMSKYNFALTLIGVLFAAATIPAYRKHVQNLSLAISVIVAAFMFGPHLIWMIDHFALASAKTVGQLTPPHPMNWAERTGHGLLDLVGSLLGCCVFTLIVFAPRFFATRALPDAAMEAPDSSDCFGERAAQLLQLIERFFLCIGCMLLLLVLSGNAVAIKTHWLHPYVFLLPTYLTLRVWCFGTLQRRSANHLCYVSASFAVVVLVAFAVKPISAGALEHYSWLNMPYSELSQTIRERLESDPRMIVTPDMRTAGNLSLQFPSTAVLSQEHPHLARIVPLDVPFKEASSVSETPQLLAIAVTDHPNAKLRQSLKSFAIENLELDSAKVSVRWETIRLPYRFGRAGDEQEFVVGIIEEVKNAAPIWRTSGRVIDGPRDR